MVASRLHGSQIVATTHSRQGLALLALGLLAPSGCLRDDCRSWELGCDDNVASFCDDEDALFGPYPVVRSADCGTNTCVELESGGAFCSPTPEPSPICDGAPVRAFCEDEAVTLCRAGYLLSRRECAADEICIESERACRGTPESLGLVCVGSEAHCLEDGTVAHCRRDPEGRAYVTSRGPCRSGFECISDPTGDECRGEPAFFGVACAPDDPWSERCSGDLRVICSGGWVIRTFDCRGCVLSPDLRADCER